MKIADSADADFFVVSSGSFDILNAMHTASGLTYPYYVSVKDVLGRIMEKNTGLIYIRNGKGVAKYAEGALPADASFLTYPINSVRLLRYIIQRLGYGLFVLLGVVIVVFFLFQLTRIHPERQIAGEKADQETIENIKNELGLDLPIGSQLLLYLNDISPLSWHVVDDADSRYFLQPEKYDYVKLFTLGDVATVIKKPYLSRSYVSKRDVTQYIGRQNTQHPDTGHHRYVVCHPGRCVVGGYFSAGVRPCRAIENRLWL